eukprot:1987954-Rhodomonas_salina.1
MSTERTCIFFRPGFTLKALGDPTTAAQRLLDTGQRPALSFRAQLASFLQAQQKQEKKRAQTSLIKVAVFVSSFAVHGRAGWRVSCPDAQRHAAIAPPSSGKKATLLQAFAEQRGAAAGNEVGSRVIARGCAEQLKRPRRCSDWLMRVRAPHSLEHTRGREPPISAHVLPRASTTRTLKRGGICIAHRSAHHPGVSSLSPKLCAQVYQFEYIVKVNSAIGLRASYTLPSTDEAYGAIPAPYGAHPAQHRRCQQAGTDHSSHPGMSAPCCYAFPSCAAICAVCVRDPANTDPRIAVRHA